MLGLAKPLTPSLNTASNHLPLPAQPAPKDEWTREGSERE